MAFIVEAGVGRGKEKRMMVTAAFNDLDALFISEKSKEFNLTHADFVRQCVKCARKSYRPGEQKQTNLLAKKRI